jgi:hypothetical protein
LADATAISSSWRSSEPTCRRRRSRCNRAERLVRLFAELRQQVSRRDNTLIRALVRAHRWRRRIESGQAKSITDLAEQEGVTDAYICRLLPLTCLAPDIVEAILDGRHTRGLRLAEMLGNRPLGWEEQPAGAWSFATIAAQV